MDSQSVDAVKKRLLELKEESESRQASAPAIVVAAESSAPAAKASLLPQIPKPPSPPYKKTAGEEFIANMQKKAPQATPLQKMAPKPIEPASNQPRHRMYQKPKEQAAEQAYPAAQVQDVTQAIKPEPEENIELMAQDLFAQQKSAERKQKQEVQQEKKQEKGLLLAQANEKKVEAKPKEIEKPSSLFGSPAVIDNSLMGEVSGATAQEAPTASQPKGLFAELENVASTPATQANDDSCPNCKAAKAKVVECPYCGKPLCANCASGLKVERDRITYICPHCSEDIEVKKSV